jgi:protein-disulfide isomerase
MQLRFVFREFPIDTKAAGASMLARCIANDDSRKYFGAIDILFKQQGQLVARTEDTLKVVGAQAGTSDRTHGDVQWGDK